MLVRAAAAGLNISAAPGGLNTPALYRFNAKSYGVDPALCGSPFYDLFRDVKSILLMPGERLIQYEMTVPV